MRHTTTTPTTPQQQQQQQPQQPQQPQQQASLPSVPSLCVFAPFMMDPSWQPVLSAAQRRKQRRLRSWWRHEQQSIAAALATYSHHSALRGQKTARAGEEDHEMHFTATFRANPPPQAAGTQYFAGGQAAGAGSAAHRGAERRTCAWGTGSRCSCAADGGPGCGSRQVLRLTACCCRAGYRSAHDHSRGPHPAASAAPGSAAGGTVGGCADDSRLCSCSRGRANLRVAGSTSSA